MASFEYAATAGGDGLQQQMAAAAAQKLLFETGSFSGYRPVVAELGSGYLSAARVLKQPFCGNEEGWGPLSPFRYDFTPCFIDVWVAVVAAFGIFVGAVAVWWLVKRKEPAPVSKDWHFWTKQVGCVVLFHGSICAV